MSDDEQDTAPGPADLSIDALRTDMPASTHPLTISEAARAAGVDRRTIRRRGGEAKGVQGLPLYPNAHRGDGGTWLIPPGDLIAVGLTLKKPDASAAEPAPRIEHGDRDRVEQLQRDLVEQRARADRLQAVLDERERVVIEARARADVAEQALRMLTVGSTKAEPAPLVTPAPARRRWWNR